MIQENIEKRKMKSIMQGVFFFSFVPFFERHAHRGMGVP